LPFFPPTVQWYIIVPILSEINIFFRIILIKFAEINLFFIQRAAKHINNNKKFSNNTHIIVVYSCLFFTEKLFLEKQDENICETIKYTLHTWLSVPDVMGSARPHEDRTEVTWVTWLGPGPGRVAYS
jgi:hypothetical protein